MATRIMVGGYAIYTGAEDLAAPAAPNITPAMGWTVLGRAATRDIAQGGITITQSQEVTELREDMAAAARGHARTATGLKIEFDLLSPTIAEVALALGNSVTTVAGTVSNVAFKRVKLARGLGLIPPVALLIRGLAGSSSEYAAGVAEYWLPAAAMIGELKPQHTSQNEVQLHFEFSAQSSAATTDAADGYGEYRVQSGPVSP